MLGVSIAADASPAEITMSTRGAKGPQIVALLDSGELEVSSQGWIYAPWKDTDFSVCIGRISWYPESAMVEE